MKIELGAKEGQRVPLYGYAVTVLCGKPFNPIFLMILTLPLWLMIRIEIASTSYLFGRLLYQTRKRGVIWCKLEIGAWYLFNVMFSLPVFWLPRHTKEVRK